MKRTLLDRSVCALVQLTKLYEVNISLNEFNTLTPRHLTNEKGGFSHMTLQFSSFKFLQTLAISDIVNKMLQNDQCKLAAFFAALLSSPSFPPLLSQDKLCSPRAVEASELLHQEEEHVLLKYL